MNFKAERLPGEEEEALKAGEKRVKLTLAVSHAIVTTNDCFSLFSNPQNEDELDLGDDVEVTPLSDADLSEGADLSVRIDISAEEEARLRQILDDDEQFEQMLSDIDFDDNDSLNEALRRVFSSFFKKEDKKDAADEDAPLSPEEETRRIEESIPGVEDEADTYIMRCSGVLSETEDSTVIRYTEEDENGAIETSLVMPTERSDIVAVIRTGGVINALICEKGTRHLSSYRMSFSPDSLTPFEVCVYTKACEHTVSFAEGGGTIFLDYYLELRGTDVQHTRMRITVKPE